MDPPVRTKGRRYGFACLLCRRRKVKCDGRKPTCLNCARSKEICSYKEQSGATAQLAEELRSERHCTQELENHIRDLIALDSVARDRRLADLAAQLNLKPSKTDQSQTISSLGSPSTVDDTEAEYAAENVSYNGGAQFSVDVEGRVRCYLFLASRMCEEKKFALIVIVTT